MIVIVIVIFKGTIENSYSSSNQDVIARIVLSTVMPIIYLLVLSMLSMLLSVQDAKFVANGENLM